MASSFPPRNRGSGTAAGGNSSGSGSSGHGRGGGGGFSPGFAMPGVASSYSAPSKNSHQIPLSTVFHSLRELDGLLQEMMEGVVRSYEGSDPAIANAEAAEFLSLLDALKDQARGKVTGASSAPQHSTHTTASHGNRGRLNHGGAHNTSAAAQGSAPHAPPPDVPYIPIQWPGAGLARAGSRGRHSLRCMTCNVLYEPYYALYAKAKTVDPALRIPQMFSYLEGLMTLNIVVAAVLPSASSFSSEDPVDVIALQEFPFAEVHRLRSLCQTAGYDLLTPHISGSIDVDTSVLVYNTKTLKAVTEGQCSMALASQKPTPKVLFAALFEHLASGAFVCAASAHLLYAPDEPTLRQVLRQVTDFFVAADDSTKLIVMGDFNCDRSRGANAAILDSSFGPNWSDATADTAFTCRGPSGQPSKIDYIYYTTSKEGGVSLQPHLPVLSKDDDTTTPSSGQIQSTVAIPTAGVEEGQPVPVVAHLASVQANAEKGDSPTATTAGTGNQFAPQPQLQPASTPTPKQPQAFQPVVYPNQFHELLPHNVDPPASPSWFSDHCALSVTFDVVVK